MAEFNALQHVTLCWNDRDVVVRHDAPTTSVPRSHRLVRAPWSSVIGARIDGRGTPAVRLELCGVAPARRSRSPWVIPVRDQRQAHELVGLVDSMAAGPEAVPAIVAAPGQPPLPAEPPEPLGALRIVRRARVWRLLFNRWAAGASGSAIASVLLLVVATAGVLVGLR